MAALRNGIHTVIIPKENETDLEKIDQTVRHALQFIPASHVDQVLEAALDRPMLQDPSTPETPPESHPMPRGKEPAAPPVCQV